MITASLQCQRCPMSTYISAPTQQQSFDAALSRGWAIGADRAMLCPAENPARIEHSKRSIKEL